MKQHSTFCLQLVPASMGTMPVNPRTARSENITRGTQARSNPQEARIAFPQPHRSTRKPADLSPLAQCREPRPLSRPATQL